MTAKRMTNDLHKTFLNKKVFLSGHTGFKGAWLALWLQELGARVKGYALSPEKNSLYKCLEKSLKCQSVIADIRNRKKLEKEILNFQPDFIFHLAAQPLVRYSYQHPIETFEVNALGTANLLEGIAKLKKKCAVVIVTTDKVYENTEKNYAYREEDKLGGHDPYSASKAAAEIIIQSYRLSFFNPEDFDKHKKSIATARAGNVIGGGDFSEDRIVPDIVRALQKNKPVEVRNPGSTRPWQYVLEPLYGYLLLAAKMYENPVKFATPYNFGPFDNDELTVEELVKCAIKYWDSGKYAKKKKQNEPHEAEFLKLDIRKAMAELNWKPKYNSEEAIKKTINWYKNSIKKNAVHFELCKAEIEEFGRRYKNELKTN